MSSKSVAQVNEEQRAKYKTAANTYKQFPVGTKVQVICVAQDFTFFSGKETGKVIKNTGDYLGIIVEFDHILKAGTKEHRTFNFDPDDLIVLEAAKESKEQLAARFKKVYANLPLGLRSDIIAVLDNEPMTWHVVKVEVDTDTPMAARILEYLDGLELI